MVPVLGSFQDEFAVPTLEVGGVRALCRDTPYQWMGVIQVAHLPSGSPSSGWYASAMQLTYARDGQMQQTPMAPWPMMPDYIDPALL